MTIVKNIIKGSGFEIWNIGEHNREFTNKCLVPFVRCDENYHVTETIYLQVESVYDAEILMKVAHLGDRKHWNSYKKGDRKELAQKGWSVMEKYLI